MTVTLAQRPGLRLSLLASVAGNTAFAFSGWLVLALLAKTTDAATVGRYVLALAVTAPVFLLTNLQLREVRATEAAPLPFAAYLRARVGTSLLGLALCGLLSLGCDGPTRLVVLLTAFAKALDAVVDVVYGEWLRRERQGLVAGSMLLRGATTVVMMGGALVLTRSLAVMSAVSVAQSALGLAHAAWAASGDGSPWSRDAEPSNVRRGIARAEGGTVREGAASGCAPSRLSPRPPLQDEPLGEGGLRLLPLLPLGLAVALDSLTVNVPRYLIQAHLGLAKVGAFGAVCTFMQLGTATVVVGLTQVGLPRLSRLYAAGDTQGYRNLLARLLAVGGALGGLGVVASVLVGEGLLALAFGPAYAPYANVLRITMLAAVAWYASGILACGVTATREFRVQLPVFAAGTLVTALSGLLLVPRCGLEGAAAAVGLGFLVRAIANGLVVLRRL